MSLGRIISTTAHAGLLGWLALGWGLNSEPLPFDISEVSLISGEEFDALTRVGVQEASQEQSATPVVEAPAAPEPVAPAVSEPAAPAAVPPPAAEPVAEPVPEVVPQAAPDPLPVQPEPLPEPTVVEDAAPQAPPAPVAAPEPAPFVESAPRPKARPSPRIAPEAVAPPPPEAEIAPETQEASTPAETPSPEPPPAPVEQSTAPQEAASEIVPQDQEPAGAPEVSLRPKSRPSRPQTQRADTAPETPTPAPQTEGQSAEASSDAVTDALSEALSGQDGTPAPQQGQANGQSLSAATLSNFLGQMRECWNLGFASADVQRTIVTVSFEMTPDARIAPGSVRLLGYTGGTEASAEIAFRAARDALTECQDFGGRSGYDLPQDKYELWRSIEMRFNPETMRLR